MGVETAAALTVANMGLSIAGGVQQYNSSKAQSALTRSYADIQQAEADREAARIEGEGNRFAQKQKMMYIGSGVEFGGSAVITIAQTKKWAGAEADAMRARGTALKTYGYRTADIQTGQGRAALIGGFAQGAREAYTFGESVDWGR